MDHGAQETLWGALEKSMKRRFAIAEQLKPWHHGAAFLVACFVLILRRPDAILHAQFHAEDGHVWFADAYNMGWFNALFQAHTGYYQTLPRLAASLALFTPFAQAPLVMNLIAILIMALPVNILLASRSLALGDTRSRLILAGIYLALPNCGEISFGITESQWLLALSAFLLLVATPPKAVAGRIFDWLILTLCGLTGPFCILLLPVAVLLAWKKRDSWRWMQVTILTASCAIQAWGLLVVDPAGRTHRNIGASASLFIRILTGDIFLATILGSNGITSVQGTGFMIFFVCVAMGGLAILAVAFLKSPVELRLFLTFCGALFLLSLISPTGQIPTGMSEWANLAAQPSVRYWFFPTLAFAWSIYLSFRATNGPTRKMFLSLLLLMMIGIYRDWHHPAFPDFHFSAYANKFEAALPGEIVTIPIYPEGWEVTLVKHAPRN
jgi:hypothetical protein